MQVVDFQTCIETSKVSGDVCSVGCQVDQAEAGPEIDQDLGSLEQGKSGKKSSQKLVRESENKSKN